MRTILAIYIFLHFASAALSQIHIDTDQIWAADTVYVSENLIVDQGVTLTINSGTVVQFLKTNFIDVYGQLLINGAIGDSVIMTAPDTTWVASNSGNRFYGWGGLYAYGSGTINAQYVVFEKLGMSTYPKDGNAVFGALRNESSTPITFEHCRFKLKRSSSQTYEGCDIESSKASIVIQNCTFTNNIGAGSLINVDNSSTLTILNSAFNGNDLLGVIIKAEGASYQIKANHFENNKGRALLDGITFNGISSVENNTFSHNLGGMELEGVYATINFRNNIYSNNGGQIYFFLGKNVITGNVFMENSYQDPYDFFGNDYPSILRVEYADTPIIVNNSFLDNKAIALMMWSNEKYNVDNNIFYNNYPSDLSLDLNTMNGDGRTFQYNLLEQDTPGTGNRKGNPRLSDDQYGFGLEANSPAINNGNPGYSNYLLSTDALDNPRLHGQIDIGAVEFTSDYVALTDLHISDTIIGRGDLGTEVARFTTTNQFNNQEVTFSLSDGNGVNNDYFSIEGDKLFLKKEVTSEMLLRIKVLAKHIGGAWLEEYFYLTVALVTAVVNPTTPEIKIYPIPAGNLLHIENAPAGTIYSILNASGDKIDSNSLDKGVIDIQQLVEGFYILQLNTGRQVYSVRFYKQNP